MTVARHPVLGDSLPLMMIVLPRYQKQGIGTMIVNHLIDYAVANSQTGTFTTMGEVLRKEI